MARGTFLLLVAALVIMSIMVPYVHGGLLEKTGKCILESNADYETNKTYYLETTKTCVSQKYAGNGIKEAGTTDEDVNEFMALLEDCDLTDSFRERIRTTLMDMKSEMNQRQDWTPDETLLDLIEHETLQTFDRVPDKCIRDLGKKATDSVKKTK